MGTETRVGIVAGLVIVVIASVYFFYGSDTSEDELLVATATRVGDAPKIPAAADQKQSAPGGKPGVDRPNRTAQNRLPAGGGNAATPRVTPPRIANGRPAIPGTTPQRPGANSPGGPIVLADPSRPATPGREGAIPLRTGPSSELVEATWDNLVKRDDPAGGVQGSDLGTIASRIRSAAGDAPTGSDATKATPSHVALSTPNPRVPIPRAATGDPATSPDGPLSGARSGSVRPSPARGAEGATLGTSAWPKKHIIAEGDTLEGISQQYYNEKIRSTELLAANPRIKGPKQLRIGDELVIPAPMWPSELGSGSFPSKPAEVQPVVRAAEAKPAEVRSYVVKSGDTLYGIAQRHCGSGARWKEILSLNKTLLRGDPKRLAPGMTLQLPE